jgi:hypothetical protein
MATQFSNRTTNGCSLRLPCQRFRRFGSSCSKRLSGADGIISLWLGNWEERMTSWEVWVAVYAAIVATAALALEVRRWVETHPKLVISVMPRGTIVNAQGPSEEKYLFVTVLNRGNSPTTITHFELFEFKNWMHRWRFCPNEHIFISDLRFPGTRANIPFLIPPGGTWQGAAPHEPSLSELMQSRRLYVGIRASHSNRPVLARVPCPSTPQ